jgi:hypothetical protein
MPSHDYPVHRTFTRQVSEADGGGYEFWCPDCSYRVSYLENKHSSVGPLVHILDAGDLGAWHTSSRIITEQPKGALDSNFQIKGALESNFQIKGAEAFPDEQHLQEGDISSDAWVTPEISAFLERILVGLD